MRIEDEEFIKLTREKVQIYQLLGVKIKRHPFIDESHIEKGIRTITIVS